MGDQQSEYAHDVKWVLNDLLRERADQPTESERRETRSIATTVADRLASTQIGTNDPVTFSRLAKLVGFPVGVDGEIEPVDVACAAYAEQIADRDAMEEYTDLTNEQFAVLYSSLHDLRSAEGTADPEEAVN